MAFDFVTPGEEENIDEDNNEWMALINHGVRNILGQMKHRPQCYMKI